MMFVRSILFLILVLSFPGWSLSPLGCLKRLDAGEYSSAVSYGNMLLKAGDKSFTTYICIGEAHLKLGNHRLAIDYLQKAHERSSLALERFLSTYYLAKAYHFSGDYQRAIKGYLNTLMLAENFDTDIFITVNLDLASAYESMGQKKEAIKVYRDILGHSPKDADRLSINEKIGDLFADLGQLEDSIKSYESALSTALSLGDVSALGRLKAKIGDHNVKLKRFNVAMENYREAVNYAKSSGNRKLEASILERLAFLYLRAGKASDAQASLYDAVAIYKDLNMTREMLRAQKNAELINRVLDLRRR